jgi:hypothetical protein
LSRIIAVVARSWSAVRLPCVDREKFWRLKISCVPWKMGSYGENQGLLPGTVSLMRYTLVLAVM